jgi:futalosine hydrolase
MKILIVAATHAEAEVLVRIPGIRKTDDGFICRSNEISLLISGVGSAATSWGMSKWISANPKPDLAINIGISGSYRKDIDIGEVVVIQSDCFADAGIENGDEFQTLGEAGLADSNTFPFSDGKILSENRYSTMATSLLRHVKAITVNTATGTEATRDKLLKKFNPDIETMEGATFFYICSGEKIPFLAIRSVSNFVEPRNRGKWNIPLALDNLAEKLAVLFLMFD